MGPKVMKRQMDCATENRDWMLLVTCSVRGRRRLAAGAAVLTRGRLAARCLRTCNTKQTSQSPSVAIESCTLGAQHFFPERLLTRRWTLLSRRFDEKWHGGGGGARTTDCSELGLTGHYLLAKPFGWGGGGKFPKRSKNARRTTAAQRMSDICVRWRTTQRAACKLQENCNSLSLQASQTPHLMYKVATRLFSGGRGGTDLDCCLYL